MAFISSIRRQFRSVIEWDTPGDQLLFYQWSGNGEEIKNASKLIVNPGQGCIFVYQGVVRSVLTQPGMYNLQTQNIPFWTTATKLMQFFESEHKVGLYFFTTTKILDQKWGTASPIKYFDPSYKFPVTLMAYGNYSFRIVDPRFFFTNVIGINPSYSVADFRSVMTDRIIQPLTDFLAESKFSYAEIDSAREEIAGDLITKIQPEFAKLGFELTDLRIEGTSFDDQTLERINRIADMTADVKAASKAGLNYAEAQKVLAMRDAARNESGVAGIGVGIGAGMGLAQMMNPGTAANSSSDQRKGEIKERLTRLKELLDSRLINETEFEQKRKELLAEI